MPCSIDTGVFGDRPGRAGVSGSGVVPRRVGRPTDPVPMRRSDGSADDSDAPRARTLLLRARPAWARHARVRARLRRTEARHPPRAEHTSARGVRKPSVRRVRVRPDVIGSRRVEQEPGDVGVTSTETRSSWSDRLSPRNWPLVWKLVAVGLVPALLALVLGVLRVADQAHTASQLDTANELLEVRTRVAAAADALRVERDKATVFIAERRLGDRGPLQDAVAQTDGALEQARAQLASATADLGPTSRTALQEAEGGFAQLPVLRSDVGGSAQVDSAQVVGRYTGVVARTDVLARALLQQLGTPEVTGLADALTAAGAASEALARQHTVLGAALRTGRVTTDDRAAVNATDNAFTTGYSFYLLALGPNQAPVNFIASPGNGAARRRQDRHPERTGGRPHPGHRRAVGRRLSGRPPRRSTPRGADVGAKLAAAGDAAARRSSNLAGLNSVALMLGLLLAATIVVLVSRSLTRSLRVLRTSALDVAQRRLPQAVESMRSAGHRTCTSSPSRCTPATRSTPGTSPARSTPCTGRPSSSPRTRLRCSRTSAACSSTCRAAARRSSSGSCS